MPQTDSTSTTAAGRQGPPPPGQPSHSGEAAATTAQIAVAGDQAQTMAVHSLEFAAVALLVALGATYLVHRLARIRAAVEFRRWVPVLYATVWGLAILVITLFYARGLPSTWLLAIWVVFLVVVFASAGWLRSILAGVAISLEHRLGVGDNIRIGEVEGEISTFGMRAVQVRSVDGTVHEIPNEKFLNESVANLSGDGGDSACEIRVTVPRGVDPDRALSFADAVAMLTPLASPRHRPEVFLATRGVGHEEHIEIHIRGYAFDPAYQEHFRSDVVARLYEGFGELRKGASPESPSPAKNLLIEGH